MQLFSKINLKYLNKELYLDSKLQLIKHLSEQNYFKIDSIDNFIIERLAQRIFHPNQYHTLSANGYKIFRPEFINKIDIIIDAFNNKADRSDIVNELLKLEYGYILPQLKDKSWQFKILPIEHIKMPKIYRKLDPEQIKKCEYEKLLSVVGITDPHDLSHIRLVDGWHRFTAANNLNLTEIPAIYV